MCAVVCSAVPASDLGQYRSGCEHSLPKEGAGSGDVEYTSRRAVEEARRGGTFRKLVHILHDDGVEVRVSGLSKGMRWLEYNLSPLLR